MDNLNSLTIASALEFIQGQKATAQDLADACLSRIERLNPTLNAFITVIKEQPTATINASSPSHTITNMLRGIPIAVKDLFDTTGIRTSDKFLTAKEAKDYGLIDKIIE